MRNQVAALQLWARTSDSDLYVCEALLGSPLTPSQTLHEVIAATVSHGPGGSSPNLTRPLTPDILAQLEQSLTLACHPTPALTTLGNAVLRNARAELAATARLRDVIGARGLPTGGGEAVSALREAIFLAAPFPRLAAEVEAARELQGRWAKRSQAVEQLEAVVEEVRKWALGAPIFLPSQQCGAGTDNAARGGVCSGAGGSSKCKPGSGSSSSSTCEGAWEGRCRQLEMAIEVAKEANISVNKVRSWICLCMRLQDLLQTCLKAEQGQLPQPQITFCHDFAFSVCVCC